MVGGRNYVRKGPAPWKPCAQCEQMFSPTSSGKWCSTKCQLLAKARPDERGCWLWQGSIMRGGYGRMNIGAYTGAKAHRVSYELLVGPIAEGMHVCHRCDVRHCVNPEHLFLGSSQDNMSDKVAKERQARGASVHTAKLTKEQVSEIRAAPGEYRSIGKRFGVTGETVSLIKRRKTWKHVE